MIASFTTLTLLMAKQYKGDLSDYVIRKGPGYGSLIRLLEREFSPKPPTHVDLISLGFWEFALLTLHETDFMKLINALYGKIQQLVDSDKFDLACKEHVRLEDHQKPPQADEVTDCETYSKNGVGNMYYMAHMFGVLQWLYEERQDILVHFLDPILETRLL